MITKKEKVLWKLKKEKLTDECPGTHHSKRLQDDRK